MDSQLNRANQLKPVTKQCTVGCYNERCSNEVFDQ